MVRTDIVMEVSSTTPLTSSAWILVLRTLVVMEVSGATSFTTLRGLRCYYGLLL